MRLTSWTSAAADDPRTVKCVPSSASDRAANKDFPDVPNALELVSDPAKSRPAT